MIPDFLTSTTTLVFIVVLLTLWLLTRRAAGLPPGPPLVPLLGNILSMGPDPRVAYKKLRQQYGDIFCVYITNIPVVVLNGYSVLREALVKQGEAFSNRPHSFFADTLSEGRGIMFASGTAHREQRTFALNTLRQFGMGKAILEDKINEEVSVFLDTVQDGNDEPQDLKSLITKSVSNILCSIAFGQRFEFTDPMFTRYLAVTNENIENLKMAGLLQVFPFLRHLPGDLFRFKKTISNVRVVERELIQPMIQKHLDNYDENNIDDFISAYIKEMRHRQQQGDDTSMCIETLQKVINDLFVAGSETTSTAIRWTLAYFLNYPDVQDRCFQEIKENIGLNRSPSMKDKTSLPYLEATIMEVLRRADLAPLAAPHSVSQDVHFQGYRLPKGISVMINLDSVLQDPDVWGDPDNFRPDRFLDTSGKIFKPDEFIPFCFGRRVCLGESLARMELFLFLAAMVQRFEFTSPNNQKPSLEGMLGLTYFPKPFKVVAKVRT